MFLPTKEYQYVHREKSYYLNVCQQIKFILVNQYIMEPKQNFHQYILLYEFITCHKYIYELIYVY